LPTGVDVLASSELLTAKLRKIQHLLKGAGTFWELLDPELSTSLLKPLESESCENFWYEKLLA